MTLKEFLSKYDYPGSVILLEGKREVGERDKDKLVALGRLLAGESTKMIFRSGNAKGADEYFSKGVASVSNERLQVITPYEGHRRKSNIATDTVSIDDIDLVEETNVVNLSLRNKKTEKLVKKYVSGTKNRLTQKAAYILRDTVKVTGTKNIVPASAGIFYDDIANPASGGTGHTMDICKHNGIPVLDQTIWFHWL